MRYKLYLYMPLVHMLRIRSKGYGLKSKEIQSMSYAHAIQLYIHLQEKQ